MDRMKALRRAAAALVLVAGTAPILSCSSDNGVLNAGSTTYDSPGDIYGYVTGPYGAIDGAVVTWKCGIHNVTLGSDTTDYYGYYYISNEAWWSEHDEDHLTGYAAKMGYQTGQSEIKSYDHTKDYQRDFYLEPTM